jgi:general secretion pathway protein N
MNRPGFLMPVLLLAALFFGWRSYEAWTGPGGAVRLPPSSSPVAPIGISPAEAPPAMDLSAPVLSIMARPLFRPDRRPFQETAVTVPARNYDQELSRFTLLGVLLLGDAKKAVITGKAPGRPERYEVGPGESLPGFEVKEIQQEGVLLMADGKEFLLPLYAGGPKVQGTGGLRTETRPPLAPPASPSAGQARPQAAPAPPETGAAPAQAGTVGGSTGRVQPPPAVAAPAQPGTSPPAVPGSPYRGRVRRTYVPGQR